MKDEGELWGADLALATETQSLYLLFVSVAFLGHPSFILRLMSGPSLELKGGLL
jgi:hypothetical protein